MRSGFLFPPAHSVGRRVPARPVSIPDSVPSRVRCMPVCVSSSLRDKSSTSDSSATLSLLSFSFSRVKIWSERQASGAGLRLKTKARPKTKAHSRRHRTSPPGPTYRHWILVQRLLRLHLQVLFLVLGQLARRDLHLGRACNERARARLFAEDVWKLEAEKGQNVLEAPRQEV